MGIKTINFKKFSFYRFLNDFARNFAHGALDSLLRKSAIVRNHLRKSATLEFGHVAREGAPRVAPRSPTSGGGAPRKRRRFACENFAHWWRDAAASKMEELHWERQGAPSCAHTACEHTANYIIHSLYILSLTHTHTNSCAPCGPLWMPRHRRVLLISLPLVIWHGQERTMVWGVLGLRNLSRPRVLFVT
jgi:hypothetical protein